LDIRLFTRYSIAPHFVCTNVQLLLVFWKNTIWRFDISLLERKHSFNSSLFQCLYLL
jgi:hypothetical protein